MPRAFTDPEREKIRNRLIAAGKKTINRLGTRLLAVDDICREAGISKGSFYSFFSSKEEFILSIFESWEGYYREALIREVSEGGGTARQKIERFFIGALEILEREPGLARMSFGEIEQLMEGLPPERIAKHRKRRPEGNREDLRRMGRAWARGSASAVGHPGDHQCAFYHSHT